MVLPGAATFDNQFSAVKLNAVNLGVDVSVYIQSFVGKTITGQTSGVTASIQKVAFTSESDSVTDLTIYVNYKNSGMILLQMYSWMVSHCLPVKM